ncbi:hypothetical protein OsJ_18539 [Oryza sativa Japonica Group]|uniref:Uncharacterized protein n=1 Tax=Oryza sativa subsp. japonica TaxID=39947 RepID=B9FPL1_ORYSJ|nr:hypothetical protein OsJ_18539 [Oryza sativa Japonica Group]
MAAGGQDLDAAADAGAVHHREHWLLCAACISRDGAVELLGRGRWATAASRGGGRGGVVGELAAESTMAGAEVRAGV